MATLSDRRSLATAPAALLALLLLTATLYEGAFDVRHWAPVGLFALVLLAAFRLAGGGRAVTRPVQVALAAVWAFAAWTLASAAWAQSTALAWEGGAIAVTYAALVTVVLVAVPGVRQLRAIGALLVAGVAVIAAITLVRMHVEGAELFVAGRLDSPVGYRNATATLFALAFWPLIGTAVTRGRNPSLRAVAFAAAVLCLGLAFLTQSRGVLVGLAIGGIVALVLGTERIRRAFLALLALGGVLVLSGPLLIAYRRYEDGLGPVTSGDFASATNALTFLVVDALIVGLLLALLDGGLRASVENLQRARRIAVVGLAVGTVGLVAGGIVAAGNPIDFAREKLDEFQAIESRSSEFSRIVSTGGQRYDLWRVAVDDWLDSPVVGTGEGSYAFAYYAERDTDRNLSNPHSLPLRLLSELGIVGTALFAVFLAAVAVTLVRGVRGQPVLTRHSIAGLAAAGTVVLAQSAVDWIWYVPGVMGIGLVCLALAAGIASPDLARSEAWAPLRAGRGGRYLRRLLPARRRLGGAGAATGRAGAAARAGVVGLRRGLPVAGLVTAALLVAAVLLSDFLVREARTAPSSDAALSAARAAEEIDPWALAPRYRQAALLEAAGEERAARTELEEALQLEPANFATLGLLGDLELRAGNTTRAIRYYRQAARLNPRDVGLRKLVGVARRQAEPLEAEPGPEPTAGLPGSAPGGG